MEDIQQERARLEAEWEKLRQAKAEFQLDQDGSSLEQKLFVGNLDDETTEDEVRALFEPYGNIKEVYMLRDKEGKSKRSSFVKVFTKASAERAIEGISGKVKDKDQEKNIVVRFAAPKQPMGPMGGPMGGMGGGMGGMAAMAPNPYAQQAQGYGGMPSYGAVPSSYGYGGASAYSSYGAAEQGYGAASSYGGGGGGGGSRSMGGGGMGGGGGGSGVGPAGLGRGPGGSNLYINNVAPTASEEEVRAMFSDFGAVLSIKLFAGQGYGFVSFDNPQSASNAIHALNGLAIGNGQKRLEVSIKKDKQTSRFSPY